MKWVSLNKKKFNKLKGASKMKDREDVSVKQTERVDKEKSRNTEGIKREIQRCKETDIDRQRERKRERLAQRGRERNNRQKERQTDEYRQRGGGQTEKQRARELEISR